jgi:hypothetical protein
MNSKYLFLALLLCFSKVISQNIPFGSIDFTEDRLRNDQLLDKTSTNISFSLRPTSQVISEINSDKNSNSKIKIQYLPIILKQQYNTFTSLSRNDGAMIPAKGYQTQFSAGVHASYGSLDIQINPEYVYAANPNFETFPTSENNNIRLAYIHYLNHSDIPVRFGDKSYHYLGWGQSSIKLNSKNFAVGISTENLWWGPGIYNSLIMSNNAPGFLHFTINTRKPIQTFLGSFEGQLINGRLENSGFDNPTEDYIVDDVNYKIAKRQEWRYLSGLSINYQPKWIPGLFIGLNRVFQIYNTDLGKQFTDYFPVITPFQKTNLNNEDAKNRDQLASIFLRWVMKESKSEIYVENGWNDHSSNLLDLFDSPSHSRAILFGLGKIFILSSNKDTYLKFNFEHTQLQQSADRIIRPAGAWYEHGTILHGYTQMGQIIGAGIGSGGNSQILDFSIWNKNKVWGIQCERYAHNLDFYYDTFTDYNHKWVDFNLNAYGYKRYGNIGVQAKLNTSWMSNYQWQLDNNKLNLQIQFALQYHL